MAKDKTSTKKSHSAENTLDAENTIRIHYLRDRAKAEYYVNQYVHQNVLLGDKPKAEVSKASPESTLRLVVWMRYLILEIWQSELLRDENDDSGDENAIKKKLGEHYRLYDIIDKDKDVKEFVERMRHRFSTHANFTLEKATKEIETMEFRKIWKCVLRVLLFKDAVRVVFCENEGKKEVPGVGKLEIVFNKEVSEEKKQKMKEAYSKISQTAKWDEQRKNRELMRDCAVCLAIMKEEFMIAHRLHKCYKTEETMQRCWATTYDLKYMILELDWLIEKWCELDIPYEPDFLARRKKYEKLRNQYSAHRDKNLHVRSVMQLLDYPFRVFSYLMQDVEEAIEVASVFFPGFDFPEPIKLPTEAEIDEVENEIEAIRQETRKGYDDIVDEYEKRNEKIRKRVNDTCDLNQ